MDKLIMLAFIVLLGLGLSAGFASAKDESSSFWKNRMMKNSGDDGKGEHLGKNESNSSISSRFGLFKKGNAGVAGPKSGSCMQTAVVTRDNAIITAVGVLSTDMTSALTARRDALKAAYGLDDIKARADARKKANDAFKGSWKAAGSKLKASREVAWKNFTSYVKANCGATAKEETFEAAMDALPLG
jgi:hypothetical protein